MKKPKAKTEPRKSPKQERAVVTVDAVLQAAAYILEEQGWDALTTNRIAQRAGVNIASVYQYFPNKESIVAELRRRHVTTLRAKLPGPTESPQRPSLGLVVRKMVQMVVHEHRRQPALHRAFAEGLSPRATNSIAFTDEALNRAWQQYFVPVMRNVPDPHLAGFIVKAALSAVVHEAARERPALLQSTEFEDELVTMFQRYLQRPAARRSRSAETAAAG